MLRSQIRFRVCLAPGPCASTSFEHVSPDHLWKGGHPACIPDGRRVLPKAICSIARLPCITIRVEQGDLDGVIKPESRCGLRRRLGNFLGTCRFRVTLELQIIVSTCLFWPWGRRNARKAHPVREIT